MTDELKTVTIKTENGPVRINAHEHNLEKHGEIIPDEVGVVIEGNTVGNNTNVNGNAVAYGVIHDGTKYFIVNQNGGGRLSGPGIKSKGYPDQQSAFAAIMELTASPAA